MTMFSRLQHIECIDNSDEQRLVVGAFYSVKDIWVSGEQWRVEVYGHEGARFPSECFRPATREATVADFDLGFHTLIKH